MTKSPETHIRATTSEILAAMTFASALFVGLALLNPDWPYSPVGWVDMHVSRLFADAPILLRRTFSDAPSGDLFSIYLPITIFGRAFGYFWGNLIWKWLVFACTGTSFYIIVRRFANRWLAAYGALLFVSYQYCLLALSGDYTDSRVVLYFSVALALSLYSSRSIPVLVSGFFFGLSAIASIQSAFLAPAFAILCFISFWEDAGSEGQWQKVRTRFLLLGAGAALCIAAAAIYNHVFFGKWFFLENSMEKAKSFLGQDRRFLKDWVHISRWTVVPFFSAALSLLAGIKELAGLATSTQPASPALVSPSTASPSTASPSTKTRKPRQARSQGSSRQGSSMDIQLSDRLRSVAEHLRNGTASLWRLGIFAGVVISTTIYIYLFFVKRQESLSNPWYLTNIAPVMFLGLVAGLQSHLEASLKRTWWIAMAILTAALFYMMHLYKIGEMPLFTQTWLGVDNFIVFLTLALLAYCLVFETSYLIPVTLLFVVLNFFSTSLLFPTLFDTRGRAEFRVVQEDWLTWVRQVDPQRRALLWYNVVEQPFCNSLATSSHAWISRMVNDSFPDCERPVSGGGRPAQLPAKGDSVIVISAKSNAVELAISALKLKNIHAVAGEHRDFVSGPFSFTATLLKCD